MHRKASSAAFTLSSHNFPANEGAVLFKISLEEERLLGSILKICELSV